MKKKILSLCLVMALAAVAVVGGTLAYFTDADKDTNTMVSGNVKIVQNETDRNGDAYKDGQKLVPAVYNGTLSYDGTMKNTDSTAADSTIAIWDETINNELDKVISVTNKGSEDAYIRTIVLMENTADNAICEKIHGLWCNGDGQYRVWATKADGTEDMVTIDDITYSIAVCTYNTALEAGETSEPSLMQVFLDPSATNAWNELLGDGEFSILALSQAVQAQGFEDAATALNTAFGEVNSTNVAKWWAETNTDTTGDANAIE